WTRCDSACAARGRRRPRRRPRRRAEPSERRLAASSRRQDPMSAPLNRRLTAQDAGFLYFERPNQPMHGVGVGIYEGRLKLDEVMASLESRLHLLPRFRQKVVSPPYGIAHPTWEDDVDFDLAHHVSEETLPAPGDDRALAGAIARHLEPLLDRRRPLWKMVAVHGRADGNTAIFTMTHH